VTRNLKEAVGKVPARRTGTAYKAIISGRGSHDFQSPIVIREDMGVDAAGIWNEGRASYPGRSVALPPAWCGCATNTARCWDGAAEISRGHSNGAKPASVKGRTWSAVKEPWFSMTI